MPAAACSDAAIDAVAAVAAATAAAVVAAAVAEGNWILVNCICRTHHVVQRVEQHGLSFECVCGTSSVGTDSAGELRAACVGASGMVSDGWRTPGGLVGSSLSRNTSDAVAVVIGAGSPCSDLPERTDVIGRLLASLQASLDMYSAMDVAIEP